MIELPAVPFEQRFSGAWGTPEVVDLFARYAKLQRSSGVLAVWRSDIRLQLADADNMFGRKEEVKAAQQSLYTDWPLAAQTSCPMIELGTDRQIGYEYGLVPVNPRTGEILGSWAPAVTLADDGSVDISNMGYSPEQLTIISMQIAEQTSRGVLLRG